MIKVLFGYSVGVYIVTAVMWKQNGTLMERRLRSDGTVHESEVGETMFFAWHHLSSTHYGLGAYQVDDIRTAFKYLGKSVDLIEMLPGATIDKDE